MDNEPTERRSPLAWVLGVLFLLALVMGPGPGAALVDGTPQDPNFIAGVPVLYVWLVFWFGVMAGCVLVAARFLWKEED